MFLAVGGFAELVRSGIHVAHLDAVIVNLRDFPTAHGIAAQNGHEDACRRCWKLEPLTTR